MEPVRYLNDFARRWHGEASVHPRGGEREGGNDVLLVDGDDQGTARTLAQLRSDVLGVLGYTAVSLRGPEIRTKVRLLQPKYECIIIEVGGRDTVSLRAALTVADILLVPVLPATFDVWSLEPLDDLIQEAKEINNSLSALVILNAADAQGRDNQEAAISFARKPHSSIFHIPSFDIKLFAMRRRTVFLFSISDLRMKRRRQIPGRDQLILAH